MVWLLAVLPSIVPWPRLFHAAGGSFVWPGNAHIAAPAPARNAAFALRDFLLKRGARSSLSGGGDVTFFLPSKPLARLGQEGYQLFITPRGIDVAANGPAGFYYAVQTLEQLTSRRPVLQTTAAVVVDWPRFRWRGMHLDTARHYFDVSTIEAYIAIGAHYKLNVFHWHAIDDQAWRLPVNGYPALTTHSRSYSADEVRAIVAYARARSVTVVPEIEMPAHSSAALSAYPELRCGPGLFCNDARSIDFFENVLPRLFALFPGRYVHIGGDEVPAGYGEAQFMNAAARFAHAQGRQAIGWSEILNPALPTDAIVEAWDSMRRAAAAARQGNETIVSGWPLYFDAAQGDPNQEPPASRHVSTLAELYAWDVLPDGLSPAAQRRVLGGEGALWTERVATRRHLFYMLLPRELALAEILWTPRERKNWPSFLSRLSPQLESLEASGYAFRIPNVTIAVGAHPVRFTQVAGAMQTLDAWTSAASVTVELRAPIAGAIRYALDGAAPAGSSPAYSRPLRLNLARGARIVRAAVYYRGRAGAIETCRIHRVARQSMPGAAASWDALVSP